MEIRFGLDSSAVCTFKLNLKSENYIDLNFTFLPLGDLDFGFRN